ncbi:MAG: tRNA epoxyqueuosine(34) reductase QueG [Gammaproteobacteria bacterium]|nr:tRNA epoxyqueuosine(34) reductase QueG [Gammaproteobacteria bacterium]MCW8909070.1 tRNA epoxyqueuosine(34) reductase QueG [Gammaproteobacteria bacterium]MCW9005411.1 tRNA epoxyqueuosine(34) reductase QueG [Gammaproteobacteria bacterium]
MTSIPASFSHELQAKARELGFQQLEIGHINLAEHEAYLMKWLNQDFHGEMDYMQRHGTKRSRPNELEPGTLRVISVRMDYLPPDARSIQKILNDSNLGCISRYALGRDYHKLIRNRLQKLVNWMQQQVGEFGYRVFTDSAPVLEKALAENAGLGWMGKHTNLINREAGSWFFLGEIYTDLPLATSTHQTANHCGSCQACMDICPTQAIVAPYLLDARRCISYLTIELKDSIPVEFRKAMGNRIYGCDDCQLACPWNRFSKPTDEKDFQVRHGLDAPELLDLFAWSENEFLKKMEGSAIRRIGHMQWLRNIAIALGNASYSETIIQALKNKRADVSEQVQEHIDWALAEQNKKLK